MKKKLVWLSEWQYKYNKEIISLDMTYGSNGNASTYGFWLHSAKVKECNFKDEHQALKMAVLKVDEIAKALIN